MINIHLYLSYLLLVLLLSYTPGPNMVLMLSNGLKHSFKDAVLTLPGLLLALGVYLAIAIAGIYHLVENLPTIFMVLKILGGTYLIYLAFKNYRTIFNSSMSSNQQGNGCKKNMFFSGFLCCLANPKILITCLAILPQFIDYNLPVLPQLIICGLTHMVCLSIAAVSYCYFANYVNGYVVKYSKWQAGVLGTIMLALGVSVLFAKGMVE